MPWRSPPNHRGASPSSRFICEERFRRSDPVARSINSLDIAFIHSVDFLFEFHSPTFMSRRSHLASSRISIFWRSMLSCCFLRIYYSRNRGDFQLLILIVLVNWEKFLMLSRHFSSFVFCSHRFRGISGRRL